MALLHIKQKLHQWFCKIWKSMFWVCLNSLSSLPSFSICRVLGTWLAPLWWYTDETDESRQWGTPGLGGAQELHDGVNYNIIGVKKYCGHTKVKWVSPKTIYLTKQSNKSSWSSGGILHVGSHECIFHQFHNNGELSPAEPSSSETEPSSAQLASSKPKYSALLQSPSPTIQPPALSMPRFLEKSTHKVKSDSSFQRQCLHHVMDYFNGILPKDWTRNSKI